MIVDPATGMPIEETPAQAQSAAGLAGQTVLGDPTSMTHNVLGNIPTATTMAMFNMGRGINTVMGGGFNRGGRWTTSSWTSAAVNTFSPTRYTSFSTPTALMGDTAGPAYTPFNNLARFGNWGASKMAQSATSGSGNKASISRGVLTHALGFGNEGEIDDAAKLLRKNRINAELNAVAKKETTLFDGGVLSRMGVASRLVGMRPGPNGELGRRDSRRLAKTLYSMNRMGINVDDLDGGGVGRLLGQAKDKGWSRSATSRVGRTSGTLSAATARQASGRMLGSFNGRLTQRAAGWFAGVSGLDLPKGAGAQFTASRAKAMRGVERGAKAMFGGHTKIGSAVVDDMFKAGIGRSLSYAKLGLATGNTRFAGMMAGKAGMQFGAKALPIVGNVLLARDLVAMGLAGVKKGAEFGQDAIKSMQGQIQKPIFGMGYKDNTVNATSRARGLTAIQQSRLNARNALGHEASMLSGHFG